MMRTSKFLMAMLLGAALLSCAKEEKTPWKSLSEKEQELYFVNTFGYNMMSTYYLWSAEVASDLRKWSAKSDPIATVRSLRYKDASGKDIDRWSMMTDDYEALTDMVQGNAKSIGMEFSVYYSDESKQNVVLVVNCVYADSPASLAGYKRGDKIVAVDGQLLTPDNYAELLEGYVLGADSVTLTNADGSDVTLRAADMYQDPIICHKVLDQGGRKIGYLHYTSFTLKSCAPLVEVFKEFKEAGITEMVLDLRYNGGGYAMVSALLGSMLAPEVEVRRGSVFLTEVFNRTLSEAWDDTRKETRFETVFNVDEDGVSEVVRTDGANVQISKLYVIMTGQTASASESTVCGLSPYLDIVLAGERSHGKYCAGIIVDGPTWYSWNRNAFGEKTLEAALRKSENWGIYVMISRFADKNGETLCMPDGLEPSINVSDNPLDGYQLGDPEETMLAAVLAGHTPSQSRRSLSHAPLKIERPSGKPSFMILDKSIVE